MAWLRRIFNTAVGRLRYRQYADRSDRMTTAPGNLRSFAILSASLADFKSPRMAASSALYTGVVLWSPKSGLVTRGKSRLVSLRAATEQSQAIWRTPVLPNTVLVSADTAPNSTSRLLSLGDGVPRCRLEL